MDFSALRRIPQVTHGFCNAVESLEFALAIERDEVRHVRRKRTFVRRCARQNFTLKRAKPAPFYSKLPLPFARIPQAFGRIDERIVQTDDFRYLDACGNVSSRCLGVRSPRTSLRGAPGNSSADMNV